jgi:hypothetical protein
VLTTKAFLGGIGMSGILVGCVLLVLAIGSGLVAFGGLPKLGAGDPLERVIVGDEPVRATPGARRDGAAPQPAVAAAPVHERRVAPARTPVGEGHGGGEVSATDPNGTGSGGVRAPGDTGGGAGVEPPPPPAGGASNRSPLPPAVGEPVGGGVGAQLSPPRDVSRRG